MFELLKPELQSQIRESSPDESAQLRQTIDRTYAIIKSGVVPAWDGYSPPAQSWTGVEQFLAEALQSARLKDTDRIWLLEEAYRNSAVFEGPASLLTEIITNAWYPSDDLYVYGEKLNLCLVFTSYDVILLFKRP